MTITEQQAQALREWFDRLPASLRKNKHRAYRVLMTERAVTGYEQTEPVERDPWEYLPERYAKQVAAAAGITGADLRSPAAVLQKLEDWALEGRGADEVARRCVRAGIVWQIARELAGAAPDDSESAEQAPVPVYGPTKAEEIGVAGATLAEVEGAIRGKGEGDMHVARTGSED